MNYIEKTLTLLNKLRIQFNLDGLYSESIQFLRHCENIELNKDIKNSILEYIADVEPTNEAQYIAKVLNPNVPLEELELIYTIDQLTDSQLLNYLGAILWSVSINEENDYLLFKYNECIFNVGWHKYAVESRGKIVNRYTMKIVSYPFDKFFNLNENASTNEHYVISELAKAQSISVTDKKDGSTIIVSNDNGNLLVTTNGCFKNDQTKWAMKIFRENYESFINNVPTGHTYIFELIHPENRIVLDYGDEEDVYLLAVRDLNTFKLWNYDDVVDFAKKYNFKVTESETFTDLATLCAKAKNLTNANKEGWVIRIEDNDYMFKLKLDEYFILHRAQSHISLKNVYTLYITNALDAFLAQTNENIKNDALSLLEEINICFGKLYDHVVNEAELIMTRMDINRDTICNPENKNLLISLVKETSKNKMFGAYILSYIKGYSVERACKNIRVKKFMELYEFFA